MPPLLLLMPHRRPKRPIRMVTHSERWQVMGMVGSARKRMLMLWQAVEMSRAMDKPDQTTLALARRALEPPADPTDIEPVDADLVSRPPLASGVPRHWSIVRCGCIEGMVGLSNPVMTAFSSARIKCSELSS